MRSIRALTAMLAATLVLQGSPALADDTDPATAPVVVAPQPAEGAADAAPSPQDLPATPPAAAQPVLPTPTSAPEPSDAADDLAAVPVQPKPRKPKTRKEREAACQQAIAGLAPATDVSYCGWPAVPAPADAQAPDPILGIPLPITHGTDTAAVDRLREKVQRLRARVAESESSVNAAIVAAAAAKEAARIAEWEALVAAVRAEHATRVLQRHAAGVYRSGGANPASLVTIINSASDDPGRVLDEQSYLREATAQKESELEQAQQAVTDADTARQRAADATLAADAAAQAAETAREQLTADLEAAETELATVEQAAVSSQTLIGDDGCPTQVPAGTLRGSSAGMDVAALCARSVAQAATPEAALAIKYAFRSLGAPYACKGVGRSLPFRFDCSSLVSRAYAEGAGLNTAGDGWAPSTRDMVPWDGVPLAPWADLVAPQDARPGDLVLYDTGGTVYRHVVMLIADGLMLHTNSCGDVAKIEDFWGFGTDRATFLVSRRVNPAAAR